MNCYNVIVLFLFFFNRPKKTNPRRTCILLACVMLLEIKTNCSYAMSRRLFTLPFSTLVWHGRCKCSHCMLVSSTSKSNPHPFIIISLKNNKFIVVLWTNSRLESRHHFLEDEERLILSWLIDLHTCKVESQRGKNCLNPVLVRALPGKPYA